MRYSLWALGFVCVFAAVINFMGAVSLETSAAVPEGYRFAVTNNYNEGSKIRTTYYVYEDHIIVEDESFVDGTVNRTLVVYDGVDTRTLDYDPKDVTEICELGACYEKPKVLAVIKRVLSHKAGREYIGF